MKNKTLITCILTAFVVLSSQFQNLSAQNNIVDMSTTIHSRGSIVREYRKDVFLVYNDDRTFNLIEILTGSCLTINLPSITVNDFEIADDTAYFCGNVGSTVVAGWFDVHDLFYSGGAMYCMFVPTGLSCAYWTSCTEEILSLDKLEVIRYNNGFNHLVMVGKATCTGSSTTNTCIVEIYNDGTDFKLQYQVEHWGIFGYDDVSVTNNEVIIIGHKRYSEGEYWTSFAYPPYNNHIISTIPIYALPYNNQTYDASDFPAYYPHSESELLIEDIPGTSRYATVCQAVVCPSPTLCSEYTCLNLYVNCSTLVYRCRIDDYHSYTYKELKYNPSTNSFFLLMEDCATNRHNGYYEFVLDNTMSYVTNVYFHQETGLNTYVSLDRCILSSHGEQCVLTGFDNSNQFYIWYHEYTGQEKCSKTFNIPFLPVLTSWGQFSYDYPHVVITLTPAMYTNTALKSLLTKICVD